MKKKDLAGYCPSNTKFKINKPLKPNFIFAILLKIACFATLFTSPLLMLYLNINEREKWTITKLCEKRFTTLWKNQAQIIMWDDLLTFF